MNKYPFFAITCLLMLASCSKDKLTTRPSITIASIDGNLVGPGGAINVTLDFLDKDGDVYSADSSKTSYLFMDRERINRRSKPETANSFEYTIPRYPPGSTKGQIKATFAYEDLTAALNPNDLEDGKKESDSVILHISIQDVAGNISDTVSTKTIVVLR
jgi:hypothetical protein